MLCKTLTFQFLQLALCLVVDHFIESITQLAWDECPHPLLYLMLKQVEDEGDATMDIDVNPIHTATASSCFDGWSARGVITFEYKVNEL